MEIESINVQLPTGCDSAPEEGEEQGQGQEQGSGSISIPVVAGTGPAWQKLFEAIATINATVCEQAKEPYTSATLPGFFDSSGKLVTDPIVLENPDNDARVTEAEAQLNLALDSLRDVLTDYLAAVGTEHNQP